MKEAVKKELERMTAEDMTTALAVLVGTDKSAS
jgi:hypothetical protein